MFLFSLCIWTYSKSHFVIGAGIPATADEQAQENATICLTVPEKTVHLSALLNKRLFRNKGDKDGGVAGLRVLEKENLGKMESINPKRGSTVVGIILLP